MAFGTASGGICYASQAEAASMWCSQIAGMTTGGLMTCSNVVTALPSNLGGEAVFQWTRRTVDVSGNVTQSAVSGQVLQSCETYDLAYFSPVVAATFSALIAVLASRWVWRFFREDRCL